MADGARKDGLRKIFPRREAIMRRSLSALSPRRLVDLGQDSRKQETPAGSDRASCPQKQCRSALFWIISARATSET